MDKQTEKRFKQLEERVSKMENQLGKKELLNKGRLVHCDRTKPYVCGHSWVTRSDASLVSCPKCGKKVRV